MSYWGRAVIGIVLVAGGIAASAGGLYGLLLTGTCASGGPYEIANPCPEGTGLRVLALVGGIFGLLIGLVIFGLRRFDGERASIGLPAWCLGFGALAFSFLFAGFGPQAPDDDSGWKVFCALMGGFFALFVLGPLLLGRVVGGRRDQAQHLIRDGRRADAVVTRVDDTGVTVGDDPRVDVALEVRPEGEASFAAEKTVVVSRVAIPRPGDRATVWYDPVDRERLAVAFEDLGEPELAELAELDAMIARAAPAPDLAEELAKLGDLRTRGVLTDEEFAKAKDRLLGGS